MKKQQRRLSTPLLVVLGIGTVTLSVAVCFCVHDYALLIAVPLLAPFLKIINELDQRAYDGR